MDWVRGLKVYTYFALLQPYRFAIQLHDATVDWSFMESGVWSTGDFWMIEQDIAKYSHNSKQSETKVDSLRMRPVSRKQLVSRAN